MPGVGAAVDALFAHNSDLRVRNLPASAGAGPCCCLSFFLSFCLPFFAECLGTTMLRPWVVGDAMILYRVALQGEANSQAKLVLASPQRQQLPAVMLERVARFPRASNRS